MGLEGTMICVDNSEYMRNGDYMPTRLDAMLEAANLLCGVKTQSHPESAVGLISLAGKSPTVHLTLTNDLAKLLSSIASVKVEGEANFSAGIRVAQLALKHRQNRNQHQRIIVFVGSPVTTPKEELTKIAKDLKKNKVAVDIINFGEEAANTEKLEAFISTVNSSDNNSHIITIPPGPHILSDMLIASPIVSEDGVNPEIAAAMGAAASAGAAGSLGDFGGVDPNLDPELAMVLRMSMEEERARQAAQLAQAQSASAASSSVDAIAPAAGVSEPREVDMDAEMSEEALLAQALAMSMEAEVAQAEDAAVAPPPAAAAQPMDAEMSEEEMLQRALEMSHEEQKAKDQNGSGGSQ